MLDEKDLCLLTDAELLRLAKPDACGYLFRKSSVTGWHRHWYSLRGSQLFYFEREKGKMRRGAMMGEIQLFRCQVMANGQGKRSSLEVDIIDSSGRLHVLRAESEKEFRWWLKAFEHARATIPPAKPIVMPKKPEESGLKNSQPVPLDPHLDADHLMLVIHGIGSELESFSRNVLRFQENYNEVMQRIFPDVSFATEFLVCHWRERLKDLEIHEQLNRVTPKIEEKNPLRGFLVNKAVDLMYYMTDKYHRFILREVCTQLNQQYSKFMTRFPDFHGQISICAHSLGSVITYELLIRKFMEDPVLLESEDETLRPEKLPFRIINVFHPNDPIAMRIEPFLDRTYVGIPPVTIPYWWTMNRRKSTVRWLGNMWSRKEKDDKKDSDASLGKTLLDFPSDDTEEDDVSYPDLAPSGIAIQRIDFALQVTSTIEEMSTAYSAVKAHNDYWQSRDLMLFVISNVLKAKITKERWRSKASDTTDMQSSAGGSSSKLSQVPPEESAGLQLDGSGENKGNMSATGPSQERGKRTDELDQLSSYSSQSERELQIAAASVVDELIEFAADQVSLEIAKREGRRINEDNSTSRLS